MAYSRWGLDSKWYIFWESTKADMEAAAAGRPKPKSQEILAIWCAQRKELPRFTYDEICDMLASGDFSRIPGFDESSRELLSECMTAFVYDVDTDS